MATTKAWSAKYEVGVKGVDRQHQELFRRANALFEAIGSDEAAARVYEMVGYFGHYVRTHLACEEKLMRRAGYPGLAAHVETHRKITAELEAIERLEDDQGLSPALVQRMTNLVFAWLSDHFTGPDREVATWLAEEHRRRAVAVEVRALEHGVGATA